MRSRTIPSRVAIATAIAALAASIGVAAGPTSAAAPPASTFNPNLLLPGSNGAASEAKLIALSCGAPPAGFARWTLRLLAERLVELEVVEEISHETVRQTLKKMSSSRGKKSSG